MHKCVETRGCWGGGREVDRLQMCLGDKLKERGVSTLRAQLRCTAGSAKRRSHHLTRGRSVHIQKSTSASVPRSPSSGPQHPTPLLPPPFAEH